MAPKKRKPKPPAGAGSQAPKTPRTAPSARKAKAPARKRVADLAAQEARKRHKENDTYSWGKTHMLFRVLVAVITVGAGVMTFSYNPFLPLSGAVKAGS